MILGVVYNIFNGDELLEDSLKQMRAVADYIVLVYQRVSNVGNEDLEIEERMRNIPTHLYDDISTFKPNLNVNPQLNETNKRRQGLMLVKDSDCTHYMSVDCDEFYRFHQFKAAKELIDCYDFDTTAVRLVNYFHSSSYQMRQGLYNEREQFVPFITKIGANIDHAFGSQFPLPVDPTRVMVPLGKFGFLDSITMHHMSYVRKDVDSMRSKLENSPNRHMFEGHIDNYLRYYDNWNPGRPALNPHSYKGLNIASGYPNVLKIDDPIPLSIEFSRKTVE